MAKIAGYKRIISEDFTPDQQTMIGKLGFLVNSAFDSLYYAFDKNIGIDNLNQDLIDVEFSVSSNGTTSQPIEVKTTLKSSCKGVFPVRIDNLTSPGNMPSALPYIAFEQGNGTVVKITYVKGLTVGQKYRIKILFLGG